jgi:hypothetical protein
MAGQYIGRDKLRAAVRKMGTEYVFPYGQKTRMD